MDMNWKMEKALLENKVDAKNVEVENLQQQLIEMRVQFTEIENRVEEIRSEVRGEVKKELEKFLPPAVEQGLRELPNEMMLRSQGNQEVASLKNGIKAEVKK